MSLQHEVAVPVEMGGVEGEFVLNVVFRETKDDDHAEVYYVAECVEMPGCISEGSSIEEAQANIEEAMRLCVGVLLEDCMKRVMANHRLPDLRGVSSQKRMNVIAAPQLQFA